MYNRKTIQAKGKPVTWTHTGFPIWAKMLIGVAVVLIALLIFFRVSGFEVSGNVRYSAEEISDACGVTTGDTLIGVSKSRVAARVLTKLPYVEKVTVSRQLPGTILLTVQECQAAGAVLSEFGDYWLLSATGKLLEQTEQTEDFGCPVLTGVTVFLPEAGSQADLGNEATTTLAESMLQDISEAGQGGQVTEVDLTDPANIRVIYQNRLTALVGDGREFAYRLQYLLAADARLDAGSEGSLDLTFSDGEKAVFHPKA